MSQTEIHNRVVGEIIASIVRPPMEAGGGPTDVLVLLESVVTGVLIAIVKLGDDGPVFDVFMNGVRERMAEIRLEDIRPAGRA